MLYNIVGVSVWPIFSLLGCPITVWVSLVNYFYIAWMFYNCVDLSVAYFFIAWMSYNSVGLSGKLFLHCLDVL